MDIVTLGAALNGSAEYVNSHFVGGTNIQIVDNPDGTQTINASGEVSSEDTVARADIAAIKDGEDIDSFGDVETALGDKVDKETGKGLSTNDYTTAEKTKLAGIAEGAEVNEIEGIKVNNTSVNPDANKVVNITIPTTAADVSALPDTTKYAVALSLTINSSTYVMTGQLKDQNGDNLGTAQTIDLPLESVVVGGSYNSQTKKVVLTLQNGNTIEFSVADLVSGLQTELSTSNKLNPAFIEYDSTHRAVSDTEKSAWNSKQNALSSTQLAAVNSGIDSIKVAQIETNKNNISYNTAMGVKNVASLKTSVSTGNADVTFVQNADKSYTLTISAVMSTNLAFDISEIFKLDSSIQYVLSGNPSSGAIRLVLAEGTAPFSWIDQQYGDNPVTITPVADKMYKLSLFIYANTSATTLTFKPMICAKSLYDSDTTYQPYAMSNAELTAKEQQNENNILLLEQANGEKNVLNIRTIEKSNNITTALNSDKSITISVTSANARSYIYINGNNYIPNEYANYIFVCDNGGNQNINSGVTYSNNGTSWANESFNNTGAPIEINSNYPYLRFSLYFEANTTITNATVKIMLLPKSLYNAGFTDYQPYALSNAELTAAIQAIQAQLANQ